MNATTRSIVEELEAVWPEAIEYTSIVGSWLWIDGAPIPNVKISQAISRLGWSYNFDRHLWQHNAGRTSVKATYDPRIKYGEIPVQRDSSRPWWNQ